MLLIISVIDLRTKRIFDYLTISGISILFAEPSSFVALLRGALLAKEYKITKRCVIIFVFFILSFSLYSESQTHNYQGDAKPCNHTFYHNPGCTITSVTSMGFPVWSCPGHTPHPDHIPGCSGYYTESETIIFDPESGTTLPETVIDDADDIDQDLTDQLPGDEAELNEDTNLVTNMDGPDGAAAGGENERALLKMTL